jgi:sterol desaturase/sphingolipid hydroxylase (fatty acid hydroxylase superfamily)
MWIIVLFAAATALALMEAPRRAYGSRGEWRREARISILIGAAAAAIDAVLPGAPLSLTGAETAAMALAVFVADDFLYYLSHRLAHRIGFFWASHAVHHSPIRFDFMTGLRQPPTWLLTPAALAPIILLAAGAPAIFVAASAALRGVHHFAIHTERVRRLPAWVEFVFNTPSHHRVHHASEAGCIDRNFGGVLILWDRLFGTFAEERPGGVSNYGLVGAAPEGALSVVTQPWRALWAKVCSAGSTRARLAALVGPPEMKSQPRAEKLTTA